MLTRRGFLAESVAATLGLAGGLTLADDPIPPADGSAAKGMITAAAQEAINRGLAFLARSQHHNGSFGTGQYEGNVAVTGLAALAVMAGGNQPRRGKYGKVVTRALDYVLAHEDHKTPGYLHNREMTTHGPMYEHAFGTLFLAEIYGMVHDRERREQLRQALKRAVDLIINCQSQKGGWRYKPTSHDADISVTICQIMALRAARNAGFSVPKATVDRCTEYVKRCQIQGGPDDGAFRYMDLGGNGPGPPFARTAAGVMAFYSAGMYTGPEVERGLKYLQKYRRSQASVGHGMYYFYGHYYAAQAMWTAGGAYWSEWYPSIRDELTERGRLARDGSWIDPICAHYATAMACIILQIPNNYLPIMQK